MSKLLLLTLNEQEEKVIDKIIAAISDCITFETMQITPASALSFPGLEIKQSQRRGMMIDILSFPGVFSFVGKISMFLSPYTKHF